MRESEFFPRRRLAHARGACLVGLALAAWLLACPARAQLFTNLSRLAALVYRLPVSEASGSDYRDGPKAIASADFDSDGKPDLAVASTDGSVSVFFGRAGGRFSEPLRLQTGARLLRGIVAADLDADGRPDIATAAPFHTNVYLFFNRSAPGTNFFAPVAKLKTWYGARNLAAGDFDGDGRQDLAVAGPNNGLRQYRSLGGGAFEIVTNVVEVNINAPDPTRFPKPVYSLKRFRPPGRTKDHLVVTHADTTQVWLLAPDTNGVLRVAGVVTNQTPAHSLDVGPLFKPAAAGALGPDLVTVQRDAGTIQIYSGTNGPDGFLFAAGNPQTLYVPGGPRDVEIVDLDGNGWNDLVVVLRYFDSVLTYANTNGVLHPFAERPVGASPRELVAGHFNAEDDSFPDLAVMNRGSGDLSILLAFAQRAGYRGVNHLYLVDGDVEGLTVLDFNGDGRDDVIQLHRASGDFSVRLAGAEGLLGPPTFFTVGNIPSTQVFTDVNGDGVRDQVTAHLGTIQVEKGFVTVRLGLTNAAGELTLGPERRFDLPAEVEGRLFALVPGDFNGDGRIDLAAGFLDSRVAFFQGNGDGAFTYKRSHRFANQTRGLVAGDFDNDGDLDLAGVSINGEMWVVENPASPPDFQNNLLESPSVTIQVYPPPPGESFGGRRIIALDQNGDGDLDLVVGGGKGAWLYLGGPRMSFLSPPVLLADTTHFVSDLLFEDLDRDGNRDLVISCRGLDCLSVFTRENNGGFTLALPVDAPASRFIATGDLDGDGLPDMVGTGRVLWTALSSHPPQTTLPLLQTDLRPRLTNLVINELLAINSALPIKEDESHERQVEWVELFNGAPTSLSLNGWKLLHLWPDAHGGTNTNAFAFPPTAFLGLTNHLLVFFSDENPPPTLYHTGFELSDDGGQLILLNASSAVVDWVHYPAQRPNISYARYRDGVRSFVFNPFPSPLRANVFNGLPEPLLKFSGVDPATFKAGLTNRFFVEVSGDVGVSSLTMFYQRLDRPNSAVQTNLLHDDGLHGDGGISDGAFAAEVEGGLPPGAELQFYFELTDLNDRSFQVPEEPEFGEPGYPGNAYQLAFPVNGPSLELSELVAQNLTGLKDETNGTPDWIEIRNTGASPVSLEGMALSRQIGDSARYQFPAGAVLAQGAYFVVFCDSNPDQGPRHAPFRVDRSGELIMLTGLTTNNSRTLIDWVSSPALNADEAFARLGAGGAWRKTTPTPGQGNVPAAWLGFVEAGDKGPVFTFAFPTTNNATYEVEQAPSLDPAAKWTILQTLPGDGIEKVIRQPLSEHGFFRVRRSP